MIYVDALIQWPGAPAPFHKGSCHLTSDCSDEELHAFAELLGLKREWFQPHRVMNHYDLTPRKRAKALRLGAIFMGGMEQIRRRRAGGNPGSHTA